MKAADALRGPVSSYSEALQWLFTHSSVEEWAFSKDAPLPLEARLVADLFWVNSADLKRDLERLWADALGPSTPPRYKRYSGWR